MFINEQIHKNAQATTILLASLCRDEYHKVSGLDNTKQIWDTLKISYEGNAMFMAMPAQAQLLKWGVKGGVNMTKIDWDGGYKGNKDNSDVYKRQVS